MKATVLVDNNGTDNLKGEWGLSILIEYKDKLFLLDTGSSDLFNKNAKALNLDISKVDYGILSHAHYDHSKGLSVFFKENQNAKFYFREGALENCYKKLSIFQKYIGLKKGTTKKYCDRIEYVSGDYELYDGVYLIPHKTPGLSKLGEREKMYCKENHRFVIDSFNHEQSLVFKTDRGLVIFNSCSHGGADNIIKEIEETFPGETIYAYIGGFHLFNKTDEEVEAFAKRLTASNVSYICTGHCTRNHALKILMDRLGDKVHALSVGKVMEF